MDTGSYMQNQMDDQIEASLHQYDEFCNELEKDISNFIKENGYTWTFEEILSEYKNKVSKGFYVSHTCRKITNEFESRLSKLL